MRITSGALKQLSLPLPMTTASGWMSCPWPTVCYWVFPVWGKRRLSMYLGMSGWKIADVPLVPPITLPAAVLTIDSGRVFGLTSSPVQLAGHRRARQRSLGVSGGAYFAQAAFVEELRAAHHLFAQHHFAVIDATDKPIETTSEEVIALLSPTALHAWGAKMDRGADFCLGARGSE
jgi:hypothetical protein